MPPGELSSITGIEPQQRHPHRVSIFVDGAFVAELSDLAALEPGLMIMPMAKALAQGDPLVASRLGTAVSTADVAVALMA